MLKKLALILLAFWFGVHLMAQNNDLSNLRAKTLKVERGSILLDSLTIIPSSLSVRNLHSNALLDSTAYQLYNTAIIFNHSEPLPDSVAVSYRVFTFNLGQVRVNIDTTNIQKAEDGSIIGFEYNPYAKEESLIDFRGLDYNGGFSRGISFGNNQDLVLNSSFNLQLAGNLGDGIEILAAITDENIPLQPEGNTQQLQEFDKIFIQLKKDNNRLIAGDYELGRPNSYFMNYFKKLQGATFSNQSRLSKRGILSSSGSVAISRGQFTRNNIIAQEGNQGPYKLQGANGERFIIVLAGTEKVWLDGQPLRRGLEEDYIIDYNRGELAFTNRRLITKDSRIIVEFEYSDQSYLRSMYAINTEYREEKFRAYVNIFNQSDSKNSTGNFTLSNAEKQVLSEAGDDLSKAVIPSLDTLEEFSPSRVAYALKDTLIPCISTDTLFSYLVFSTNPDSAKYTASFTLVGPNQGTYILDTEQAANERVYRWVGIDPFTCTPLGNYEAIRQLIPPKQQQLITAGGEYYFSKNSSLKAEFALSKNDFNRFSSIDNEDNDGIAIFTDFKKDFPLGKDSSGWNFLTNLSYEFVQEDFQALNPYRNPEFLRDWNIANIQGIGNAPKAREQIGKGGIALVKQGLGMLEYSFSGFLRDSLYTGLRHQVRLDIAGGGWDIDGEGSLLMTDETTQSTQFFRPKLNIVKTFKRLKDWRLGAYGEREKSDRYNPAMDTLTQSSFYYDRYRFFLLSPEVGQHQFGMNFSQRLDYAPIIAAYLQNTKASEFNVNGQWKLKRNVQLRGNFTYRQLEVLDSNLTTEIPAETFLGRGDLNWNMLKGVIRSGTTYEIGSGQEPKLEFTYIRVNQGEGTHVWLDSLYNNDGIIQPHEMEIAPFQDLADYIKISTISEEFIRTNNVNLNQSLQINPKAIWFNAQGVKKFLAKLSTQSSWKINRKTQDADGVSPWNPFQLNIPDTALVTVTSNIRNTLFFNRGNPKADLQIGQTDNWNRFVQSSGFESRRNTEQFVRTRWNISKVISIQGAYTQGKRQSDSEFFKTKSYIIAFRKLEPQLTFLPSKNFRTIFRYRFQNDKNTLGESGENSLQHDLNVEITYNQSSKTSIRGRGSVVKIDFEGEPNSPVGFAILNGLQPGQNYLWNLTLNRQLAKNIQLNISYEGRKTGTANIVHVGRAQVAATF